MAFKNYMEDAILFELNDIIKDLDGCSCGRCKEDIVARTLNQMPAKYVVTDLGHTYTKMNQLRVQSRVDIQVKLMESAAIIKANPRH
ncbi:late competence development ComFB family protein [bacterium]|nr:late competence development ComFB family protein [bacterium]